MRTFKADEELKNLFIQQGFEETTSDRDKKKGKCALKLNGKGKKEICFNYINIQIFDNYTEQDNRYTITEKELNILLLFFKLDRTDYKLIQAEGVFNFKLVENKLSEIREELNILKEKNLKIRRQSNLKRILRSHANIEQDYQQNINKGVKQSLKSTNKNHVLLFFECLYQ